MKQRRYMINKTTRKYIKDHLRVVKLNESYKAPLVGLSYILSRKHVAFRIMWFCIILCCSFAFCYQTYDRFSHYNTFPIRVDVEYVENSLQPMPSATICSHDTDAWLKFINENSNLHKYVEFYQKNFSCANQILQFYQYLNKSNLEEVWKMFNTFSVQKESNLWKGTNLHLRAVQPNAIYTPMGICTHFVFNKNDIQTDNLRVIIRKPKGHGGCRRSSKIMMTFQENNYETNWKQFWQSPTILSTEIIVSRIKYNFLSMSNQKGRCVRMNEYAMCSKKCRVNIYEKSENISCRHLFDDKQLIRPMCNTSNENAYNSSSVLTVLYDPVLMCNCSKLCNDYDFDIRMHYYYHTKENLDTNIKIDKGTYVTTFTEVFDYDVITLLGDIGGSVGLLLGLSVLSLCEILNCLFMLVKKDNSFKLPSTKSLLSKQIKGLFKKEMINVKNAQANTSTSIPLTRILKKNKYKTLNYLMVIIYLLFGIFCSYFTLDRMSYFWTYPIKSVVQIEKDIMIAFPSITICAVNYYVDDLRNLYFKKTGMKSCKSLDHYVDVSKVSVVNLWENSSTIKIVVNDQNLRLFKYFYTAILNNSIDGVKHTDIATKYGNCAKYDIGLRSTIGTANVFSKIIQSVYFKHCDLPVLSMFILPEDTYFDLALRNELDIPENSISNIVLKYKKITVHD